MGFFALTLFVPFISGIQFVFNPNSLQCYCTINELTLALPEVSTIDENFEWMIAVECGDICKHTHTQRERTNNRENEFCKVEDKNTGKSIFPKLLIVFCFFLLVRSFIPSCLSCTFVLPMQWTLVSEIVSDSTALSLDFQWIFRSAHICCYHNLNPCGLGNVKPKRKKKKLP